jgi:hypothetical protein
MNDLMPHDNGLCCVCGALASERCDYQEPPGRDDAPRCHRWVCDDHLVIEAQAWDTHGWDGVDVRCHAHQNLSLDARDWARGRQVPPAPRWAGEETGLLITYEASSHRGPTPHLRSPQPAEGAGVVPAAPCAAAAASARGPLVVVPLTP